MLAFESPSAFNQKRNQVGLTLINEVDTFDGAKHGVLKLPVVVEVL